MKLAVGEWLREGLAAAAAIVFPGPCRACGSTLTSADRVPFCSACRARVTPLAPPLCARCGRPFHSPAVLDAAEPLCRLCRAGTFAFDCARSYALYDDVMVRALVSLKHHPLAPLGAWLAERMAETMQREPERFAADVVVPVPLHARRLRERGHNQAELIARPLARRLGLPMRSYLLVRTRPRPDRLKLTRRQRWETVRGAYATRAGAQVDKLRVILVDDVLTTGATLDACARALYRGGAARVVALTAARVVTGWAPQTPPADAGRRAEPLSPESLL